MKSMSVSRRYGAFLPCLTFPWIATLFLAGGCGDGYSPRRMSESQMRQTLDAHELRYDLRFAHHNLFRLDLSNSGIRDLSILEDMPLHALVLDNTEVHDLSPLGRKSALVTISIANTAVTDLAPLRGLYALSLLRLNGCKVTDLSPLETLDLGHIWFSSNVVTEGIDVLRGMQNLTTINDVPVQEFWQRFDAGDAQPSRTD